MTNEITATTAVNSELAEFVSVMGDLLLDPMNMMPLVLAFALGGLYSLSPHITRMKRLSDKKFQVYMVNLIVSVIGFIVLNHDAEIRTLMSSLMFVAGASILMPMAYFNWIHKKDG